MKWRAYAVYSAIIVFCIIGMVMIVRWNAVRRERQEGIRDLEHGLRECRARKVYYDLRGQTNSYACNRLLTVMDCDGAPFARLQAFKIILRMVRESGQFHDIYSNALAKASVDAHGLTRVLACDTWSLGSNEQSTKELLAMVQREYGRRPADRFLLYPGRTFCPGNRCGPDWVLMECMKQLINLGRIIENYKTIENVYLQTESREMKFFLAHVLYRLGGKPDVELLVQAVDKSLSPYVKAEIINDIKEIGDRRALPALRKEAKGRSFYPKGYEPKDRAYVRECAQAAVTALEKAR